MHPLKQSSSSQHLCFVLWDATDPSTPLAGASPTVTLSKNGGSFASPSGSVTEVGNGLYRVAGNATDTNTLGILTLRATATGAKPTMMAYSVVAYDPADATALGLSRLDASISTRNATAPLDAAGTRSALGMSSANLDTQLSGINSKTTNLPASPAAVGSAMTLTSGEREDLATVVEAHLLNEGDSQMLINAIVGAIGNVNIDEVALVAAIRADLERTGGNLNSLISRLTSARAGYLDKLNVSGTLAHSDAAATYRADVSALATSAQAVAIKAVTDKLDTGLEADGGLFRWTANALEQAPAGGGGGGGASVNAIWDEVMAGHAVAGSAGAALNRILAATPAAPIVTPPAAESLCNVFVHTSDILTDPVAGLVLKFELSGGPTTAGGVIQKGTATLVTDEDGMASAEFLRTDFMTPAGREYLITCPTLGLDKTPFVLESAQFNIADLVTP